MIGKKKEKPKYQRIWNCPKCNAMNFPRDKKCFLCGHEEKQKEKE